MRKSRQTDRQQGPLSRCLYVVPRDLKIFQKKRVHYISFALQCQTILAGRKWKDLEEKNVERSEMTKQAIWEITLSINELAAISFYFFYSQKMSHKLLRVN